ncbi:hypothetical protein ACI3PL_26715, partial [Lacticaseibacillus paracasei]
ICCRGPAMSLLGPDLSDEEVDQICAGLKQNAAKVRFLKQRLKVRVDRKPNGRPLVNRAHYDAVRGRVEDRR